SAALKAELQITDAVATVAWPTGRVFPEVDGLAPQGVTATEGALIPGAARQSDLQPPLAVASHRGADAAVTMEAFGNHHAVLWRAWGAPLLGLDIGRQGQEKCGDGKGARPQHGGCSPHSGCRGDEPAVASKASARWCSNREWGPLSRPIPADL